MATENVTHSVFDSASLLIGLQLFSRLFTFGLNQGLVRMVSPKVFGTAAIQFELLLSTILFLSREGVRIALLRAWPSRTDYKNASSIRDISQIPMMVGLPFALIAVFIYGSIATHDTRSQPYFHVSIYLYALAAFLELMSEPMHNRAMGEALTSVRVRSEALGVTSRTVITFLVLLCDHRLNANRGNLALLAFALGQVSYAVFLLASYLSYFGSRAFMREDSRSRNIWQFVNSLDAPVLRISVTMTAQSIFKHLLTEGDKFILSWISPLKDQGGYALAVNYASLIARIVFQPVEEIIRIYFSKALATSAKSQSLKNHPNPVLYRAASAFLSIISTQTSFSVLLLCFGTHYINLALSILLPVAYQNTSAPNILAAWVWYIPVLALNGSCEAFMSSVSTSVDLNRQSRWMAAFSCMFLVASIGFYRLGLGDTSLVYANILNLSARIVFCAHFINSYFHSRGVEIAYHEVIPEKMFLFVVSISYVLIRIDGARLRLPSRLLARAEIFNSAVIGHIALGGILAVICLGVWWIRSGRAMKQRVRQKVE